MKKLLLITALALFGCSSDEQAPTIQTPQPESVTVTAYSFTEIESGSFGNRYRLNATVRNNTAQSVSGKVVCAINDGSFMYVNNVVLSANETQSVSQDGILYFDEVPEVEEIYFE